MLMLMIVTPMMMIVTPPDKLHEVKTSSKFETYPKSLVWYQISVKCRDVSGKLGVLKVG